jgi:hypothetical protein
MKATRRQPNTVGTGKILSASTGKLVLNSYEPRVIISFFYLTSRLTSLALGTNLLKIFGVA